MIIYALRARTAVFSLRGDIPTLRGEPPGIDLSTHGAYDWFVELVF